MSLRQVFTDRGSNRFSTHHQSKYVCHSNRSAYWSHLSYSFDVGPDLPTQCIPIRSLGGSLTGINKANFYVILSKEWCGYMRCVRPCIVMLENARSVILH